MLIASTTFILCIISAIVVAERKDNIQKYEHRNITYTEHEKNQIVKLKQVAKHELDMPFMKTDKYLISWVRDNPSDLNLAYQKLRKYTTYRNEYGLENILEKDWTDWNRRYPFAVFGHDFNGCGVVGLDVGSWDIRKAVLGNPKEFDKYLDYALEYVYKVVYDSICLNGTAIINLHGYSARQHGCLQCVSCYAHFIGNLDTHYPRIVKKITFINTPRIFQQLLRILIPLLSPHTARAIETFGVDRSEWQRIIRSRIPHEILPLEFGGTKKGKTNFEKRN